MAAPSLMILSAASSSRRPSFTKWLFRTSRRGLPSSNTSFRLISSVDPKFLKLTKADEQIYGEFRKTFGELKIDVLDPEELKSEPAKEKWRPFCMRFEGVVEDFNYGTLLRLDCSKGYTEENTIFATRIQFFAIEIARNREGCNSAVYNSAKKPAAAVAEGAVTA
ncbi:protein PBDC1 [Oxyura jamaicensis]|uniref:protein PBDC1 n=1 Tax=Oxyura jamaicensis TaxID=8884 RepID=UPI0015A5AA19|nr:protein PBDC1 [Oxyura jamaicensis]